MKRFLLFFIISYQTLAQYPAINWSYDIKDNSFGQSAAADLDGDGFLEIVFSTYRNDGFVYCLNSEDGSLLWKYDIGGCGDVAPLIFDVDEDGKLEVVVAGSCNPKTFCLNGATGDIKWIAPTKGSDSPPTIADFNGDGRKEILHGEFGGYVISIDAKTGAVNWNRLIEDNSWIQTAPTVCNLNGDNYPDYVVASWNFDNDGTIYGFCGKTDTLVWKNAAPSSYFYHGSAVADLDKDGKDELVLGCYDGYLYVLNGEDGSIFWKYTDNEFYTAAPAVIADLDKDGAYEIVFSNYIYITALRNDGSLYWKYEIKDYGQCFRGVAMSDIDGDTYLDVVFGDTYGVLRALKGRSGDTIWTMNLSDEYGDTLDINHAPLIADFDRDGLNDVFIIGGYANYPDVSVNFGRAYMITAGEGKGPQWLMFQLNPERNSFLSNEYISAVENVESETELELSPNPAGDYIRIKSPFAQHETVFEIYNIFGIKLMTAYKKDAGDEIRIDVSLIPSGAYYIRFGMTFSRFVKL